MKIRKWWRRRRRRKNMDTLNRETYHWKKAVEELDLACIELKLDPDNIRRGMRALDKKQDVDYCITMGFDKAEEKLRVLLAEELAEYPPCGDE